MKYRHRKMKYRHREMKHRNKIVLFKTLMGPTGYNLDSIKDILEA
jgi:hypothetical protein